MSKIVMYGSMFCGYCHRAREFFRNKRLEFQEVDVDTVASARAEMIKLAGGRTSVPQIFIDGTHIGGCDDLLALDRDGRLGKMIGN